MFSIYSVCTDRRPSGAEAYAAKAYVLNHD